MSNTEDEPLRTRAEHLAWCKERALQYVNAGDLDGALASMGSDMQKHPGTAGLETHSLGLMLAMSGHLNTSQQMRNWIEGFN